LIRWINDELFHSRFFEGRRINQLNAFREKNDVKTLHLLKARPSIPCKHESASKTTATNEEQEPKQFQGIPLIEAGMEMLRNEEQPQNAKRPISRSCDPFAKVTSEIHAQPEKQDLPIISTEAGIGIWIARLKHRIATVRDLFRMNPSENARRSFPSLIVTVSMLESSKAEKSNSLKHFGRKSDFRAEQPAKALSSILFREDDCESSIDDNFLQLWKASWPRTETESGTARFTSDTQQLKAQKRIMCSVEPCSNTKVTRLGPRLVVTLGRVNDLSDEH
jgi:hypothetical protein